MKKITFFLTFTICLLLFAVSSQAADQNYAVWFSPVRSPNLWRAGNNFQYLVDQKNLLDKYQIPNTWLVQYDVLNHQNLIEIIKNSKSSDEVGLFLEVSKDLAWDSFVNYDYLSEKWERADKLFLSGYRPQDRIKLIDTAFAKFKETFGYYPETIGAWHIDGYSLRYMKHTYQINSVLGLADQYLTDGYQVWGQYIGEPYYPESTSVIEPAKSSSSKINVVKFQWAPRHPLLAYGIGHEYSNYSTQLNDYYRDKQLPASYFSELLSTYTKNVSAPLAQITLGLEVGELDQNYLSAFKTQLETLILSRLQLASASAFASIYQYTYPDVSPSLNIVATSSGKTINWYMSPQFRLGVLNNQIVDLHWYHQNDLPEHDQFQKDSRQNLYQVVPAEIDSISLGNTASFSGFPVRPVFPKPQIPEIPFKSKLLNLVSRYLPDFRYSRIGPSHVIGLRTDPEHLVGIQTSPLKFGKFYFQFPYLESFINLDKYRFYQPPLYSRQDAQLAGRQAVIKNSTYGIENLKKELLIPKSFENSLFYIPK